MRKHGTGTLDIEAPQREARFGWTGALVLFGATLVCTTGVSVGCAVYTEQILGLAAGLLVPVYLLLGYLLRPKPNMDDLAPDIRPRGSFRHNRISDDINRWLLVADLALIPGRVMACGVLDLVHLLSGEDDQDAGT